MSGACHSAVTEVRLFAFSVGIPGTPGGSFTSVTLMVMAMASSIVVSLLWAASMPSCTFTVTL